VLFQNLKLLEHSFDPNVTQLRDERVNDLFESLLIHARVSFARALRSLRRGDCAVELQI
jgi:hypothetical protein